MIKDSYYIQGQKGEYITLKKDADDEYSYLVSLKYEDAEIMDLEFAKFLLKDLNEVEGEEYFRICKVEGGNQ